MAQPINRVPGQRSRKSVAVAASMHEQVARTQRLILLGLIAFAGFALVMASTLRAQEAEAPMIADEVTMEMQMIITNQINAFLADDAAAAYAYASPNIKRMYPTATSFVAMVQRGYPVVYQPQSFSFLDSGLSPQGPAQQVEFVGMDGQVWQGVYTFSEQDSGGLMISGVYLQMQNEQQI